MKVKYKLYGAILGDIAGQPYEFPPSGGPKDLSNFNLHNPNNKITDDTIMTLASAASVLYDISPERVYKMLGSHYIDHGYGNNFEQWLKSPEGTVNNSWGNGCLMRMSPFMYTKEPLLRTVQSVLCSHAHDKSIATCLALWEAYQNHPEDKKEAKIFNKFDVSAEGTIDFVYKFVSNFKHLSTQEKITKSIEFGGDTDTNASIIGELSNYHNDDITEADVDYVRSKLDQYLLSILDEFNKVFKEN